MQVLSCLGIFFATYHIESENRIHLDHAMEIAEENGDGQQENVDGITDVVAKQFNELADKHPGQQRSHRQRVRVSIPRFRGLVAQVDERHVTQEGWRRQRSQMDGIGAPWLAAATQTLWLAYVLYNSRFLVHVSCQTRTSPPERRKSSCADPLAVARSIFTMTKPRKPQDEVAGIQPELGSSTKTGRSKWEIAGKPASKGKCDTYYQIYLSLNMLVKLLLQLLRDHRAHCFRNLGLSSSVVLTSTSG